MLIIPWIILLSISTILFFIYLRNNEDITSGEWLFLLITFLIVSGGSFYLTNTTPLEINNTLQIIHYSYQPQTTLGILFFSLSLIPLIMIIKKSVSGEW